MAFKFNHNNFNVLDLERSLEFYQAALGLVETKRHQASDGTFTLVFLGDLATTPHRLELTWMRDRQAPYDLGENESHLAFTTDDFEAAYQLHQQMGCICHENKARGLYFINDPDGYWLEIIPEKK